MRNMVQNKKTFTVRLLTSVLVGVLVFIMCRFSLLFRLDSLATDSLYQYRNNSNIPIHVIGIDERTLQALGNFEDWDRSVYAELINKLCADGNKPAIIAFDILFTGNRTPEGDAAFVDACAKHGNVIVGSSLDIDKVGITDEKGMLLYTDNEHVRSVTYPFDELNKVVTTGFVDNKIDRDGIIRSAYLTNVYNGQQMDSLSVAVYRKYLEQQGLSAPDYTKNPTKSAYFTYSTNGGTFVADSMIDVLDGTRQAGLYDNEIVMVGAYAQGYNGFQDDFPTAKRGNNMYGVVIHADIIRALDSGALQFRTDRQNTLAGIIYGIICAIIMFLLLNCSLPKGGIIAGITIVLITAACVILYRSGIYVAYVYPVIAICLAYLAMIFIHYLKVRIEKAKINNAFKMYVSPQVVEEVSKSGTYELKLGGQTKDIACLFIDIRGFTTMSEGLDPETVVGILNEYFAVITDAIFKNGGTLDKFIGDAAMAVYNSPFDLDDYEMRAIRSALDIAANSEELRNKLLERFGRTINFGIGINCGPATIGNIGCDFRMDFTAIGDTVNTASRLESNAKAGQILISEAMYERVKDRIEAEDVGGLSLKGKANIIHTYNVLSVKEE